MHTSTELQRFSANRVLLGVLNAFLKCPPWCWIACPPSRVSCLPLCPFWLPFLGSCLPLSPILPLLVSLCWMACPPSRGSCLPLSPVVPLLVPQTGLPVWGSYSFQRVASLGRMISPLSPGLHPTLGALGRMSLHLSSTCLSHLSATLGALGRMSLQFKLVSHTCLSHLSRTLGALGTMILHLSPTLVFHTCLPHLSPTLVALGRMSLHLSPTLISHTCLPLWVPWAA